MANMEHCTAIQIRRLSLYKAVRGHSLLPPAMPKQIMLSCLSALFFELTLPGSSSLRFTSTLVLLLLPYQPSLTTNKLFFFHYFPTPIGFERRFYNISLTTQLFYCTMFQLLGQQRAPFSQSRANLRPRKASEWSIQRRQVIVLARW